MRRSPADARIQGLPRRGGEPAPYEPDLRIRRRGRRRILEEARSFRVQAVRPSGSRKVQCSGENPGLANRGFCMGRLPEHRGCKPRNQPEGRLVASIFL